MISLTVDERDIEIQSARIKVRVLGAIDTDKPVLVFLHEGLGSITQWRRFPEDLCVTTGLSAIIYDRTGYGRSSSRPTPWPDNFLINEAHALPLLLEALGINKPILFGHSDGGTIALMVAALYPHLPLATITEAAHVLIEPITKRGLRSLLDKTHNEPDFVKRLLRHHPLADHSFITNWVETWLRPSLAQWNMRDMLPAIICPVLVLQGNRDEHGSPQQVEYIVKEISGPSTAIMIADCGHVPHIEAGKPVIEATQRFLQNHLNHLKN